MAGMLLITVEPTGTPSTCTTCIFAPVSCTYNALHRSTPDAVGEPSKQQQQQQQNILRTVFKAKGGSESHGWSKVGG